MKKVNRRKKPKLLVVDDEQDNLDLLYRTFRRDFQVIKAENGVKALETLSDEGEVAVIISDQRMPQMKGTEFLSKTVPDFPDTVRIILTGFTDVEDLVDAINSGQVYKYITKPWEPNELKAVVDHATETYALLKQRTERLEIAKAQTNLMETILQVAQESLSIEDCLEKIAIAMGKTFSADSCILQVVQDHQLISTQGNYTNSGEPENYLDKDPLVKEAIASGEIQTWVNSGSIPPLEGAQYYLEMGIQAHLLSPLIYRKEGLGVLSLKWKQWFNLPEEVRKQIHLLAQQIALVLYTKLNAD
ncbi:MAG: response regulator [Moorea sp. SIO2B7]|nr:response regulator [Moorena sp. SIO2B7]